MSMYVINFVSGFKNIYLTILINGEKVLYKIQHSFNKYINLANLKLDGILMSNIALSGEKLTQSSTHIPKATRTLKLCHEEP